MIMMSSSSSESSDDSVKENTPPRKKPKRTKRVQNFRKEWEKDYPWVASHSDKSKAECKICGKTIKAEIQVLKTHSISAKHILKAKANKLQKPLDKFTIPSKSNTQVLHENAVKNAELTISAYIAEHNLAFLAVDHLIKALKQALPDSAILKDLTLGRTKVTALIKNVIAIEEKKLLANKLKVAKFSILTDESTDISCEKTCCIVVRYFDEDTKNIKSKLWEIVQIYDPAQSEIEANAEHLFNLILESFRNYNIPLNNIIGFGSDGCNLMMGCRNSVSSRFRELCPGIVIIKCVCHSAHLCASESCKQLPRQCEDFCRNIYNHFKASAKRQSSFKQFQMFLDINIHKLLHPSQTRWLSLTEVVNRILEQWEALKLYFTGSWLGDRLHGSEQIFHDLNDPFLKLFLLFMKWVLPKFTDFNKYFQAERCVITELHTKIKMLYLDLLKCYMDRKYIEQTNVNNIDPMNQAYFLPPERMYFGILVIQELNKPTIKENSAKLKDFYFRVQKFFSVACVEIRKRYNFEDELLCELFWFNPENAVSPLFRDDHQTLMPIMSKSKIFLPPSIDEWQIIDNQWRYLPEYLKVNKLVIKIDNILDFWVEISMLQNELWEMQFKELSRYVFGLLSIPHSNAECERQFSKVNLIKTKLRNKVCIKTLNGAMLASQHVKKFGACFNFEASREMRSNMNKSMYSDKDKGNSNINNNIKESELESHYDEVWISDENENVENVIM